MSYRYNMHGSGGYILSAAVITMNFLLGTAVIAEPKAATGVTEQADNKKTPSTFASALAGKNLDVSRPYGSHLQPILDKIKASPEQRTKISAIVQGYRSRIQPLREEYKQKRQEFLASMTSGSAAETIMTKQVELSHLSSEISSRYTLMRLEIRRHLTPQQILQFEDYAREHGWNKR